MSLYIKQFVFNPFLENTYIVYNENGIAMLVDPGCCNSSEQDGIISYMNENGLKLKYLVNTHAHIDHILGNKFVYDQYNLTPLVHQLDLYNFEYSKQAAKSYQINYSQSPMPTDYLKEGDIINLDADKLEIILTPGHTSGSISLYSQYDGFIICGDTLFKGSIGRVDLPGGDMDTLIDTIKHKILTLPVTTIVYPGHGQETTVQEEIKTNVFLN